ncbi:lipopolysaccharide biosynthesis protein [Parasediminibacterium sp. JCM 36343]|uniref:lipopolysaccharide biosynthesis protein n=1 Tax=Parasediminibacterium sp. JCM 36343 TaxID=3374279 RepID=UPI00397B0F2A
MSSSKVIAGGIFWTTLSALFNAFYGFISVPILLVHFGKQQYGLIGLALSINVYLRLMDMGFSSGNVRFFSILLVKKEYENLEKLFQSSLVFYGVIGLINAIVLLVVSIYSKGWFHLDDEQNSAFCIMLYVLMFSAFWGWISSLLDQFLRANEIIGWEQRLMIFAKIVQLGILFYTVKFNLSMSTFFAFTTLSSLIIIPFSIYKIKGLGYIMRILPKYNHAIFKNVIPYSVSIFSFSIFQFSANYLRPLILGTRLNVGAVAEYRILEGFANMVLLLGTSFVGVILPMATKATSLNDKKKENQIAYDGTKYISIFLGLITFSFVLISKFLILVYVGDKYLHLVIWLNIWVLTLLATHNSALSSLVLSRNDLRPVVYISAFSSVSSLVIAWFLTPYFKVGGVVLSYLFYCSSQIIYYYGYYYKHVLLLNSKKIFMNSFLRPVSCLAIVALAISYISKFIIIQNIYLNCIVIGLLFALTSAIVIYKIILNENDIIFIKNILTVRK